MCHSPIRNKSKVITTTNSVFGGLAIVATVIRSLEFRKHFGLEDIFVIFGLVRNCPQAIMMAYVDSRSFSVLGWVYWNFSVSIPQLSIPRYVLLPDTNFSNQVIDSGYGRDIWTISFPNITLILKVRPRSI
jgi:hypothetical protein